MGSGRAGTARIAGESVMIDCHEAWRLVERLGVRGVSGRTGGAEEKVTPWSQRPRLGLLGRRAATLPRCSCRFCTMPFHSDEVRARIKGQVSLATPWNNGAKTAPKAKQMATRKMLFQP